MALAYPDRTFTEVAAIFSFFLVLKGAFDAMYGLMSKDENEFWWVGLIAGMIEILLSLWAAGNFGREAVLLVVWIGAGALARGNHRAHAGGSARTGSTRRDCHRGTTASRRHRALQTSCR